MKHMEIKKETRDDCPNHLLIYFSGSDNEHIPYTFYCYSLFVSVLGPNPLLDLFVSLTLPKIREGTWPTYKQWKFLNYKGYR